MYKFKYILIFAIPSHNKFHSSFSHVIIFKSGQELDTLYYVGKITPSFFLSILVTSVSGWHTPGSIL